MNTIKGPSFLILGLILASCSNDENAARVPINTSYDLAGPPPALDESDMDSPQTDDLPTTTPELPIDFTSSDAPDIVSFFALSNNGLLQDGPIPENAPVVANMSDSAFGITTEFTDSVSRALLVSFNERINAGELFSSDELACFNGYNAALGEPLVSLRCETPLPVVDEQFELFTASFANTSECRNDLQMGNAGNCSVAEAYISIITSEAEFSNSALPTAENPLANFFESELISTSITFGASSGEILEIQYNVLQSPGDVTCQYALSTGELLNIDQVEICISNTDNLASVIRDLNIQNQ